MKKLFFLCAFLFISIEMQAQLYIVHTYAQGTDTSGDGFADSLQYYMTTIAPDGSISTIEIPDFNSSEVMGSGASTEEMGEHLQAVNNELNLIISLGYKLVSANTVQSNLGLVYNTYYLAAPWTTVGLTEIDSSELDLSVSPNPAKDYINVEVNFKSQPSELVLISEGGYVYFKKDISNIMSGQEFRLDISNMPAGKYLVTVKDDKQYLTPKKLMIF